MTFRLAFRSFVSRPVRTAVLAAGFGLGVAVMAALLGVAAVILEQARAPELVGGGDVILDGATGRLPNARFAMSALLNRGPLASQVSAAAPLERTTLFLIDEGGATPIRARGGIPSLERAMRDPETSAIAAWTDTPSDARWARPSPDDVLREMDRFHRIPAVPRRADSWAEWLYFNGRLGDRGFYLTFMSGPRLPSGNRRVGVRLQLEQSGRMTAYSDSAEIRDEDLLREAPDLSVKANTVRLVGHEYRIRIDLPAESGAGRATGELVLEATPGRSLPPIVLRGARNWISGYVVPAMSGAWKGSVTVTDTTMAFTGAAGYHDHNWGFWEGVTWQWGQVQGAGLSFVYGRIIPPADVIDPSRVPALLMALGAEGPVGYSSNLTITEQGSAGPEDAPQQITVRQQSDAFAVTIDMRVTSVERSRQRGIDARVDFLQMRTDAHVTGQVNQTPFDFTAPASAETFRGRPATPD